MHYNLYSVSFGDNNTLYTTGTGLDSSTILKSTDAGISFTHLSTSFLPAGHLTGELFFLNADTGYITSCITTGSAPWTYSAGTIYRTVNGGISWSAVVSGIAGGVTEIKFADASTGYATVSGGSSTPFSLYKTTDGGLSWTSIYTSPSATQVSDLQLVDGSTGFILAQDAAHNAMIIRISGGSVGTSSTFPAYNFFQCGHFTSATNGVIAAGTAGTSPAFYMLKTTDGGLSWSTVYSSGHNYQQTMVFDGASLGFAIGGAGLTTTDGGDSWSLMDTTGMAAAGDPFDMAIRNGVRIMVGEGGTIRRFGPTTGFATTPGHLDATIYPNPVSQTAEINFGKTLTNGNMNVYNMAGRLLATTPVHDNRATLNAAELTPGMYTLQVTASEGNITKNIVVRQHQ